MSVSEFGAIKQLLCEQIPEDNPKRGKHSTRIYRRHRSLSPVYADRAFTEWDICRPPVGVLSNLELTSVQFSTGEGQCNAGEDIIYRREPGFVSAVRYGGKVFWIKGPSEESGVKRSFGVYGDRVEYLFETRGLQVRETVYVTRGAPYETHSFELFCESNEQDIRDSCMKLIIPQAVVDEMKAVPMSRTDDYILCCQGLERVNQAVKSGIAEFAENPDGIEFSIMMVCSSIYKIKVIS